MSRRAPFAHDALSETTFLLCKPDAEHAHRHILQVVSEAGFHVQAKNFRMTAAIARDVAKLFPSVQKKRAQEQKKRRQQQQQQQQHRDGVPGLATTAATAARVDGAGKRARDRTTTAAMPSWRWDARTHGGSEAVTTYLTHHVDEALPRSQTLLRDIVHLTHRRRSSEAGVDAGLPTDEQQQQQQQQQQQRDAAGSHVRHATTATTAAAGAAPPHATRSSPDTHADSSHNNNNNNNKSVVAAEAHARLDTLSYDELLREHVRHLAYGGTCLAVLLVAPEAVDALLRLVGPEDPHVARCVAPDSLRARLGSDVVRNAVYAASNLAEVSACVTAVFGYAMPHYNNNNSNSSNNNSGSSSAGEGGGASAAAMTPTTSMSLLPAYADGASADDHRNNGSSSNSSSSLSHHRGGGGGYTTTHYHDDSNRDAGAARTAIVRALAQLPSPCSVSQRTLGAVRTAAAAVAEWCAPSCRVSYYIDGHPHRKQLLEQLGCASAGGRDGSDGDGGSGRDGGLYTRALTSEALLQLCSPPVESAEVRLRREQQALVAERAHLARQAQQLRMREMDLLLREHALTTAATTTTTTTTMMGRHGDAH